MRTARFSDSGPQEADPPPQRQTPPPRRQTPSPVNRMKDASENIILPQTSFAMSRIETRCRLERNETIGLGCNWFKGQPWVMQRNKYSAHHLISAYGFIAELMRLIGWWLMQMVGNTRTYSSIDSSSDINEPMKEKLFVKLDQTCSKLIE